MTNSTTRGVATPTWIRRSIGATVLGVLVAAGTAASADSPAPAAIRLGLNVAAWDGQYTGDGINAIDNYLVQAGIGLLRYPGGSWADAYDWHQIPISLREFGSKGILQRWSYSPATTSLSNPIVQGTVAAAQVRNGFVLPAESIVVVAGPAE